MAKIEANKLGIIGATAYIVATIIGSGIFIAPKGILKHAGSVGLSLILWVVCALLNMLSAINFVELGTSIPESGCELAYYKRVGWQPLAFSFLYLSVIIQSSCSAAVLFLTFGNYLAQALDPIFCFEDGRKKIIAKLFGFGLILSLTLFNMFSLKKFAARLQILSMFSKLLTILAIILIGAYFLIFKGYTQHYKSDYIMKGSKWSPSEIVLAIYQGNWAFGGFNTLNFGTEEIEKGRLAKILMIASLGGLAIAAIVYVLCNVAYFVILSPDDILNSDAVATTFIQKTLGTNPAYFMPAIVGLLLIGTTNGDIFTWSRYMLAGSKKGLMPSCFALIHPENDSPRVSVFTHTFLSICFAFVGNTDQLVNYLSITTTLNTIFIILSLIVIKWKKLPVAETAVQFSIIWPVLNLLINLGLLFIPFQQDVIECAVGIGVFICGVFVYFAIFYPQRRLLWLNKVDVIITRICQLIFWTVPDDTLDTSWEKVVKKDDDRRSTTSCSSTIASSEIFSRM